MTPVAEIGQYKFKIGDITRVLMDDFTALIHPAKIRAAVAGWGALFSSESTDLH